MFLLYIFASNYFYARKSQNQARNQWGQKRRTLLMIHKHGSVRMHEILY